VTAIATRPAGIAQPCPACGVECEVAPRGNVCATCGYAWYAIMPQPGPQTRFLQLRWVDILGYGGAAGGGKTWALLMDALADVHVPGFTATFFRRTLPQITNPDGLWDASLGVYPHAGGRPKMTPQLQWRFPSGARVVMTHLHEESDKLNHQGSQYADILWDELTHCTATQFWYLMSRNRSTCGVAPRCRATFNADAASWVKELFAPWVDSEYRDPAEAGEVRWLVHDDRADQPYAYFRDREAAMVCAGERFPELTVEQLPHAVKSVTFVPADVYDNPALMESNPQYLANLLALPEVERQRLLYSNWEILQARFFSEWRPRTAQGTPWHVIPTGSLPESTRCYLAVDWGFSAPFAAYLVAIGTDGRVTVCREIYTRRELTSALGVQMVELLSGHGQPPRTVVYAGHDCFNRRLNSAGTYDEPIVETWWKQGLNVVKAGHDPLNRANKWREYLRGWGPDEGWPDGRPGLQVMACCVNLIRTIGLLQSDARNPEIVDTTGEDHAYDAVGHLLTALPRGAEAPAEIPVQIPHEQAVAETVAKEIERMQRSADDGEAWEDD